MKTHNAISVQSFGDARKFVCHTFVEVFDGNKELSRLLEKSILDYSKSYCIEKKHILAWSNIHFRRIYLRKYRSILFNLKDVTNTSFKMGIMNDKLNVKDVPYMSYVDVNPPIWNDILSKIQQREINTIIADNKELQEGAIQCKICKMYKTKHTSVQIRRADEPMTTFVSCLICKKNWKM
jgi:DNA-directed RNA polymerase subunit M/transcription elongation factor TFIIS